MSLSAEYHAKLRLQNNPDRATVEKWVAELEACTDRLLAQGLGGMDGRTRTIHMNSTQIRVFKAYLSTLP